MVKKDKDLFSHQFSPSGRAGGSHLLRYSRLAIGDYGCALRCLAYGSLQLVQNSGNNISLAIKAGGVKNKKTNYRSVKKALRGIDEK